MPYKVDSLITLFLLNSFILIMMLESLKSNPLKYINDNVTELSVDIMASSSWPTSNSDFMYATTEAQRDINATSANNFNIMEENKLLETTSGSSSSISSAHFDAGGKQCLHSIYSSRSPVPLSKLSSSSIRRRLLLLSLYVFCGSFRVEI